jgi:hypothetical protein
MPTCRAASAIARMQMWSPAMAWTTVALAKAVEDGRTTSYRFEAAPVSAAAQRATLVDCHMAEFAGATLETSKNGAIQDEARTEALTEPEIHRVLSTACRAEPKFGQCTQICLVINENRALDAAVHQVGDRETVPAAHQASPRNLALPGIHGCGQSNTDGQDFIHARVDGFEHVGDQQGDFIEFVVGSMVFGERHIVLGDHRSRDIRERNSHVPCRNMHACDDAESTRESDVLGAPTAARGHRRVQDRRCRELFHDVGNRRRRQACSASQLHLSQPAVPLDRIDDAGPVGFTK